MRKQRKPNKQERGTTSKYHKNHQLVRKVRGPAWQHQCECNEPHSHVGYDNCQNQAEAWATRHGTDGTSVDHYIAMCWSCHARYDDLGRNLPDNIGSKRSAESREKMRQSRRKQEAKKQADKLYAMLVGGCMASPVPPSYPNRGKKKTEAQKERQRQIILQNPEKYRESVLRGWETRRANGNVVTDRSKWKEWAAENHDTISDASRRGWVKRKRT